MHFGEQYVCGGYQPAAVIGTLTVGLLLSPFLAVLLREAAQPSRRLSIKVPILVVTAARGALSIGAAGHLAQAIFQRQVGANVILCSGLEAVTPLVAFGFVALVGAARRLLHRLKT